MEERKANETSPLLERFLRYKLVIQGRSKRRSLNITSISICFSDLSLRDGAAYQRTARNLKR